MPNPYHDADGKFCSRVQMVKAIDVAGEKGDFETYKRLREDLEVADNTPIQELADLIKEVRSRTDLETTAQLQRSETDRDRHRTQGYKTRTEPVEIESYDLTEKLGKHEISNLAQRGIIPQRLRGKLSYVESANLGDMYTELEERDIYKYGDRYFRTGDVFYNSWSDERNYNHATLTEVFATEEKVFDDISEEKAPEGALLSSGWVNPRNLKEEDIIQKTSNDRNELTYIYKVGEALYQRTEVKDSWDSSYPDFSDPVFCERSST